MTTPRCLLFCLALCCVGAEAAAAPPAAPNADPGVLRAMVQAEARRLGARGVEFGMWVGDREVLTTAVGESMTTVPATADMHYRIGGIAETFMSTLLLMLVEKGAIGLDDPIARWFPKLLDADKVTVRMLVGNTAGYPDYVRVDDFAKLELAEPFRTFTDDELIDYSVRGGKMNFAPGTSQQYSHTDNVILGQVIQRATGQSMRALYETYLFGPLGMRDTRFRSTRRSRARCCMPTRAIARSTRTAPTGTRSGARRRACPPPASATWESGVRSSGPAA